MIHFGDGSYGRRKMGEPPAATGCYSLRSRSPQAVSAFVTPPLAVRAGPDRPARHAGEGRPSHSRRLAAETSPPDTPPEPRARADSLLRYASACGCARLGGWRRASSTPPPLEGAASRLSLQTPHSFRTASQPAFRPVEGRCRDFANAAGQFAPRQPACAAGAFAPALPARSRLDGAAASQPVAALPAARRDAISAFASALHEKTRGPLAVSRRPSDARR